MRWTCIIALIVSFCAASAGAGQFSPPDDTAAIVSQLDTLYAEITQGRSADAATHIDALVRDHSTELIKFDSGLIESVPTRIRAILADPKAAPTRDAVIMEYEKQFEGPAQAMLQSVMLSGGDSRACYAVAQRYPLSGAATAALGLAGDRAALMGDLPSAGEFYSLAQSAGWNPDAAQHKRMDAVLAAGYGKADRAIVPLPQVPRPDSNPGASIAPQTQPASAFSGLVPYDAIWWRGFNMNSTDRYFPTASGGLVFFAAKSRIGAFTPRGDLRWAWLTKDHADRQKQSRNTMQHASPFSLASIFPAILETGGIPQIIVAPWEQPDDTLGLVAISAQDGRTLWTTNDDDSLSQLWFSSSATIAGNYVYTVATDATVKPTSLLLLALDVNTGHELWRTALGTIAGDAEVNGGGGFGGGFAVGPGGRGIRGGRGRGRSSVFIGDTPYPDPAGMTTSGDQIVVVPQVGYTISIGRFDGKIRWMNPYEQPRESAMRYHSQPAVAGNIVIAAPQDTTLVEAYDLASGVRLWEEQRLPASTLVGVGGGDSAIFSGTDLQTINLKKHVEMTKYTCPPGVILTGPFAIFNGTLYVPSNAGVLALSADSLKFAPSAVEPPSIRTLLASPVVRDFLLPDGVLDSFDTSNLRIGSP